MLELQGYLHGAPQPLEKQHPRRFVKFEQASVSTELLPPSPHSYKLVEASSYVKAESDAPSQHSENLSSVDYSNGEATTSSVEKQ